MTRERKNRRGAGYTAAAVALLVSVFLLPGDLPAAGAASSPSGGVKLPPVESAVLENGIKIFYIRNDLPTITIAAAIGMGVLYEDASNAGISKLIARSISLGGSKKYPGNRLHEEVESLGGKFSISDSWENMTISVKVLSRYREKAIEILSDVIKHPNFEEKYIGIAKSIIIEKIKRRKDDPAGLGFMKTRELIFNGTGYGSVTRSRLIKKFTKKDIKNYWEKHARGGNCIVGVSAASGFSTVLHLLKKRLRGVNGGSRIRYGTDDKKIADNIKEKSSNIYLVAKNLPQSTIIVGTSAPDIRYRGDYALSLMNYILGGGSFNSWLIRDIRVKKGYAYVAHSILRNRGDAGVFLAYTQTKNANVVNVIPILMGNIRKISTSPVKKKEREWAVNSLSNSYIFKFDTPLDIVGNYLNIAYYGLPEDYYSRYLENIRNVGIEEIRREGKKLFRNGLVKLVVGPASLKQKLSKFGKVVVIDEKDLD